MNGAEVVVAMGGCLHAGGVDQISTSIVMMGSKFLTVREESYICIYIYMHYIY